MTKHFIFGNQNLDVEIVLKIKLQITFSLNFSSGYYMSLPRKLTLYVNVFTFTLICIHTYFYDTPIYKWNKSFSEIYENTLVIG